MADEKLPMVTVQATGKDGKVKLKEGQVVLWEVHPDHPENDGEAFISHDGIVREVAETPLVKAAIADGRLTTKVDYNTKQMQDRKKRLEKAGGETTEQLRKATDEEEDDAGLVTPTERNTAFIKKGQRP